jgi:hypothetical protein
LVLLLRSYSLVLGASVKRSHEKLARSPFAPLMIE